MLIALVVAGAILGGAHSAVIAVGVLAAWQPVGFLAATGVYAAVHVRRRARSRRPSPSDEVAFLHGMAAELRSGASLRAALATAHPAAGRLGLAAASRKAMAGLPAGSVAEELRRALPINGRLAAAAFTLTAETGARAADVFEALAVRAAEAGELVRERRSATAQARLSALVVGLAPLAFALVLLLAGGGAGLPSGGIARMVVLGVGFGLQLAGLAVVWLMLWKAER